MRLAAVILFASLVLFAREGHTSSAYGNSLTSPSFRYTYVENVRKAFISPEQGAQYMAAHDRDMKLRFLGFQAAAEKAIADARKKGTPVAPHDLFLPSVRLEKPADVVTIDAKAYPLNLVLDVSDSNASSSFEVTATKPWTAAQVTALTTTLGKIAKAGKPADDKALEAAKFTAPTAVTHVDDKFGLYVGTTTEVAEQDRAAIVTALQASLDKLLPGVRKSIAAPDVAKRLGLKSLKPIKAPLAKHPQKLPGAFNPWGPLVGEDLVRVRVDLGNVSVIVMIAPAGKYDWGKVHPVLTEILREAGTADPHRELIESEAQRLAGENR